MKRDDRLCEDIKRVWTDSHCLSIRYSERLDEAGISPSVGSTGDSYDNAMAETINGLYKAEVVNKMGPWESIDTLEWETMNWVGWFNQTRLLEPIGNIPPAEFEALYAQGQAESRKAAQLKPDSLRDIRGGSSFIEPFSLPKSLPTCVKFPQKPAWQSFVSTTDLD